MARFTSLFQVAQVLQEILRAGIQGPALAANQIIIGAPLQDPEQQNDHVRITLLWINEPGTHRNDIWEKRFDGTQVPPPLTIAAYFLITTYGNTQDGVAVRAHQILGEVLRVLHDRQELTLPLVNLGEGMLRISLMQMTPELMEKLMSPLQIRHRPFALYEVGPIQLVSRQDARAPVMVSPQGINLEGPFLLDRPQISRITPRIIGAGGRVRIDGTFPAANALLRIGADSIVLNQASFLDAGRTAIAVVPNTAALGAQNVSVTIARQTSEPDSVGVVDANAPSLDAPNVLEHSRAASLMLSGRSLGAAISAVAWPDAGLLDPSQAHELQIIHPNVPGASVEIVPAELSVLPDGLHRISLRLPNQVYLPYVLLEVTP